MFTKVMTLLTIALFQLKYELDFAGSESHTGKKTPSAPPYEEDAGGGG